MTPHDLTARRVVCVAKKWPVIREIVPIGEPDVPATADRREIDRLARRQAAESLADRLARHARGQIIP